MIEVLSSWAKSLGLTIVVVSILEMLLPNNMTKKYIRMVMGVYVIFNIISPLIENKEVFDVTSIDIENYTNTVSIATVDQTSMNERIKDLYIEELEKDITKKVEEQGYKVSKCKVTANISSDNEEESLITKIKLTVKKDENFEQEESEKNSDSSENVENKIVTEIQKIKTIDTSIEKIKNNEETEKSETDTKISRTDIQNIKKFLIKEYGVSEKCLEIN